MESTLSYKISESRSNRKKETVVAYTRYTIYEEKAATAAFLASVSQALQVPLANLPSRRDARTTTPASPTPATTLHRSRRLANQSLNYMVRARCIQEGQDARDA